MNKKWIALLLAASAASSVEAQGSATLNRFAASETTDDDFHVSRPLGYGHLRFGSQLHVDYASDPLVWERTVGDPDTEGLAIVSDELRLNLNIAFGLFDRVVIYAGVPFVGYMNGASSDDIAAVGAGIAVHDDGGFGDAYLGARVRLFGDEDSAAVVGLQVTGTFPTAGGSQSYLGDEFLSIHPELLLEFHPIGPIRLVANVGAKIRENVNPGGNLFFGDNLTFALGLGAEVWGSDSGAHLDVMAQAYGSTEFDDFFGRGATPVEALAGLKFFTARGIVVGLAGGPGLARGFGSPDFRIVGMIGGSTGGAADEEPVEVSSDRDNDGVRDDADGCPTEAEDMDGFADEDGCPESDNDGDQIPDASDQCPSEAEDVDSFEDDNGCPDPDNDGDGILDASDSCPTVAEDVDGFQDTDGCAELDNDADGLADGGDRCPNEAGPAENNGCPDPDRDGDGVPDRLDNCPEEAGTVENQGCQARQQVRIENGRLEILDMVYFQTNSHVIQRRSFDLLRNVAMVVKAHPELTLIRVEGHTDARGNRDRNVSLSQRRAESVRTFLVREGVEEARLTAQGFGPDRPLVPEATSAEDHARNRRVEFNLGAASEVTP